MVFDLTAGLIVLICVASALFGLFPWADQVPHLLLSCAGAVSGAVPCHLAYHAAGSSSNQKTLHKWGEQLAMSCSDCRKTSLKMSVTEQRGKCEGAKSPLRVQSTRIFKLYRKFKNTHSVAKRLFRHAVRSHDTVAALFLFQLNDNRGRAAGRRLRNCPGCRPWCVGRHQYSAK